MAYYLFTYIKTGHKSLDYTEKCVNTFWNQTISPIFIGKVGNITLDTRAAISTVHLLSYRVDILIVYSKRDLVWDITLIGCFSYLRGCGRVSTGN